MVKFARKHYVKGKLIEDKVEYPSYEYAKEIVGNMFKYNIRVVSFEERYLANENKALSVKDAGNKIIYQLKTIK